MTRLKGESVLGNCDEYREIRLVGETDVGLLTYLLHGAESFLRS